MVNDYSSPLDYDELYHHGILGQKWGIRRYQNYDGSLTAKGKARVYKTGPDGVETFKNRMKRSFDAAQYEKDIYQNQKNMKEGDYVKTARALANDNTYKMNRAIMLKDLSSDEIELGRKFLKNADHAVLATKVTAVVGGAAALATSTIVPAAATVGMAAAAPVGAGLATLAVGRHMIKNSANYKNAQAQQAERHKSATIDGADEDRKAINAAKKAGLNQGDNWKVYRDAQRGDKEAAKIVKEWESQKSKSKR